MIILDLGFLDTQLIRKWLVPHFEKMLYDNALLAIIYLETYQVTKKELYSQVAREIFEYILRDMTDSEGGFYCAEDADSEGEEGKFYVWTKDEIEDSLGERAEEFCDKFDITDKGNFEEKNIPNLIEYKWAIKDKILDEGIRKILFDIREKRVHPHKDNKILTSWNGLMIAALAYGGRVLDDERYVDAAKKQWILY